MLLVVVSHTCDYYIRSNYEIPPIWYGLVSCVITVAVPVFFILSGYLNVVSGQGVKKQFMKLGIPYITWTFVYGMIGYYYLELPVSSFMGIFDLVTGYLHLYFIVALLQLHLLYASVKENMDSNKIYGILLISASVTFGIYALAEIAIWVPGSSQDVATKIFEPLFMKFGLTWGGFYFLGVFFAMRPKALKHLQDSIWQYCFLAVVCGGVHFVEYITLLLRNDDVVVK